MRKHLYGILAAVVLCIWKAAAYHPNQHILYPFCFYHCADNIYDLVLKNEQQEVSLLQNAREYAQYYKYSVPEDHIIKQYMYISAVNRNEFEIMRSAVMVNVYLTIEAYFAAVNYRVCVFFYSAINKDKEQSETCLILSAYMEWYFSFMFEEKVKDFCNIKTRFNNEENTFSESLTAEYVCEILRKLNLNFLRFPTDDFSIHPLDQNDENNVYDANVLTWSDVETGQTSFISIFEHYMANSETQNQSLDDHGKRHPQNAQYMIPEFQAMKIIWDDAPLFIKIMNLPTEQERGIVSMSNEGIQTNTGKIIYRSNAVEILRQSSYYALPPLFSNGDVSEIINEISKWAPQCNLIPAVNSSVDYYFNINVPANIQLFLFSYFR